MQLYPAIDLQAQQCVRLYQGQFDRATVYHHDPVYIADQFKQAGADWLHLVDLDAAKQGDDAHAYLFIKKLLADVRPLSVQIGGGIRCVKQIDDLLKDGAKRVIIGSHAVKKTKEVLQWFKHYDPEQLVLALDIRLAENNQAYVCIQGWQETTSFLLEDMIKKYQDYGLKHLLCTDVQKDGTLQGPNILLYQKLLAQFPDLHIQASGGISSLTDIQTLKKANLKGAVLGRALYENKFTLQEALALC